MTRLLQLVPWWAWVGLGVLATAAVVLGLAYPEAACGLLGAALVGVGELARRGHHRRQEAAQEASEAAQQATDRAEHAAGARDRVEAAGDHTSEPYTLEELQELCTRIDDQGEP